MVLVPGLPGSFSHRVLAHEMLMETWGLLRFADRFNLPGVIFFPIISTAASIETLNIFTLKTNLKPTNLAFLKNLENLTTLGWAPAKLPSLGPAEWLLPLEQDMFAKVPTQPSPTFLGLFGPVVSG